MNAPGGKDPREISSRIINGRNWNFLRMVLLGIALLSLVDGLTSLEFIKNALPDSLVGDGDKKNKDLVAAIATLILVFPTAFYCWNLRNQDKAARRDLVERQQLETMFLNARKLFLDPDSVEKRAEGLKQLMRLRQILSRRIERKKSMQGRTDSQSPNGADISHSDRKGGNLGAAILQGANLKEAILSQANLSGVDLSGADLSRANLNQARLGDANFSRANLNDADLCGALISGTNFEEANLEGANLRGLVFNKANLKGANLENANLEDADLRSANLDKANLEGANLKGAMMPDR